MYVSRYGFYPLLADEAWLRQKHCVEGLSHAEIAREVGCGVPGARSALLKFGIYQPKRYRTAGQRLADVTEEQLLADAATVHSWNGLGKLYGTQRTVVQGYALLLDVFDKVEASFIAGRARARIPLQFHPQLSSPSWIATAWANSTFSLSQVAHDLNVPVQLVERWMKHHGMTVRELREARDNAIALEYLGGMGLHEVAITHRMDYGGVWRILHRRGIDTTKRKRGNLRK